MSRIKAIKTNYKGITFRSKLEAQWAATFDNLTINWSYEPEGYFIDNDIKYLPDFYLPEQDVFFEVKGIMNSYDWKKIDTLRKYKETVIGYSDGKVSNYDERSIAGKAIQKAFRESQIDYTKLNNINDRILENDLNILRGESVTINNVFKYIENQQGVYFPHSSVIGYGISGTDVFIDDYLLKERYKAISIDKLATLLIELFDNDKKRIISRIQKGDSE